MIVLMVTGILRNFPTYRHESLNHIQLHKKKEHCLLAHPYPTDTAKVNIYCTQALKNRVTSKRFVRFRKNPHCIAGWPSDTPIIIMNWPRIIPVIPLRSRTFWSASELGAHLSRDHGKRSCRLSLVTSEVPKMIWIWGHVQTQVSST